MIQLEKNAKAQQIWIPRSSTGSGDVRKTYKDGYQEGFQEGLKSSKIKLYDGMKLGYSKIYNLDDFSFESVTDCSNLFSDCSFYGDIYDFTEICERANKLNNFLESTTFYGVNIKNPIVKTVYTKYARYLYYFGMKNAISYITVKDDVKSFNNIFYANTASETHLDAKNAVVNGFISAFNYNRCPVYYFSNFDMSNDKYPDWKIFTDQQVDITDMYLDNETVPRATLDRLMGAYRKETDRYARITFHYGKERWTWDSDNNKWAITGYDE